MENETISKGEDKMNRYDSLRSEVRQFCSDSAQNGLCSDPEQQAALKRITDRLDEISQAHPEFDAMKMRRVYYDFLPDMIPVKIFLNAPFYFAVGINGGWGASPAQWFFRKFSAEILHGNVPPEKLSVFDARRSAKFILCCGPYVDQVHHMPPLRRILQSGFKGVYEEVLAELKKTDHPEERDFLETAAAGLEAIHAIQLKFCDQARELGTSPDLTGPQQKFMCMAAAGAESCPWEPPKTFFEGLNLLLFVREILSLTDSLAIFALGRPDAMLNDLYEADLAAGRITKEDAYDLISRFLVICDAHYDGEKTVTGYCDHELEQPVTVGGCDENGNPVYNDLTKFIIHAHRENDLIFPKTHCRISAASPKEYLLELAADVWNGRCVHTLFNDDTIIPGLRKQGKTLEQARSYYCAGCWNGYVDSIENVDDANYYSLARVLEAMIYQDPGQKEKFGFDFEALDDCLSAEEIRDRVCRNIIGFMRSFLADYAKYGSLFSQISPHPAYSACLEGCIANRKDETRGGARFSGRVIVLAFLANVVDSILAIKRVCFDQKICPLPTFLDAVRDNWKNAEDLRQEAMKAHYWGDGSAESMELGKRLLEKIRSAADDLKNERGGGFYFSIWIYREFRYWGEIMRALPDGRHDGDYLSQALNPSEFRNREEITTTLNALACLDYTDFASSNINLTFDRENISPEILEAIFRTFAEKKLQLLQPNCFSRGELEDAVIHPEKHHNLIVKVCGFSARFVVLSPEWQKAVMSRYRY